MFKKEFSILLILLSFFNYVIFAAPPAKGNRKLFECSVTISAETPVGVCSDLSVPGGLLSIPPSVFGSVVMNVHHTYDTQVCLGYATAVDGDTLYDWKDGACGDDKSQAFWDFPASASKEGTLSPWFSEASIGSLDDENNNSTAARFVPRYTLGSLGQPGAYEDLSYQVMVGSTDKGFTGNATTTVTVTVYAQQECPIGMYGPNCVKSMPLMMGIAENYTIPAGEQWAYFDVSLPENGHTYLSVLSQVTATSQLKKSPITVYVRWQGLPYDISPDLSSSQYYDYRFSPKGLTSQGNVNNPVMGRYFLALYSDSEVPVTGSLTVALGADCSTAERYGADCVQVEVVTPPIKGYTNYTKVKSSSKGLTYTLYPASDSIEISVSTDAKLAPDIYLGAGFVPNEDQYTLSVSSSKDKVNRLSSRTLNGEAVDWFLGVGSAASTASVPAYVWEGAICAQNCSNRGYCQGTPADPVTGAEWNPPGTCQCNDGFNNFACQDKVDNSFPLEYIILIAVGGAILLVIVVGVPLYCYFHKKQSRDSRYESLA